MVKKTNADISLGKSSIEFYDAKDCSVEIMYEVRIVIKSGICSPTVIMLNDMSFKSRWDYERLTKKIIDQNKENVIKKVDALKAGRYLVLNDTLTFNFEVSGEVYFESLSIGYSAHFFRFEQGVRLGPNVKIEVKDPFIKKAVIEEGKPFCFGN